MCDFFGAILDHGFLRDVASFFSPFAYAYSRQYASPYHGLMNQEDVRKCHVVAHAATQCSSFDQLHKVIILWPNGPNVSTRSTPENAFCSLEGF